jgi:hypothetical protein
VPREVVRLSYSSVASVYAVVPREISTLVLASTVQEVVSRLRLSEEAEETEEVEETEETEEAEERRRFSANAICPVKKTVLTEMPMLSAVAFSTAACEAASRVGLDRPPMVRLDANTIKGEVCFEGAKVGVVGVAVGRGLGWRLGCMVGVPVVGAAGVAVVARSSARSAGYNILTEQALVLGCE